MVNPLLGWNLRSSHEVGDGVMIVTTGDNVGELEGDGVVGLTLGDLDGLKVGLEVGAQSSL